MAEARVERRLAAILAADVAGYSRLMGADEEGTLAALKELRQSLIDPKIAYHHGRIVKTTGDGVLVEFSSAVDAVRCAVEIQCAVAERNTDIPEDRRIEFRIGINVGDIIIDQGDIYGDGVNIAARLEGIAKPGGTCISDDTYRHVRGKLDIEFEGSGEHILKNISHPVRVFRLRPPRAKAATSDVANLALPNKPSIAVLPFQNMSGDPDQDYFADGIVEDIITALSRNHLLFVIARNSSFTYKGRAVDVRQVGRELGVRYLLEGSVRKSKNRLRITGQLVDNATGAHLWADRFDGALEDVFDLQDRVTSNVVAAILPKLEQAESERAQRKPTESLDAYDLLLRGMVAIRTFTSESLTEASQLFQRAIALDPHFSTAYGMLAWYYFRRYSNGLMADPIKEIPEALRIARRAVELGNDDALALCMGGITLAGIGGLELEAGEAYLDRAITLNPNLAIAWTNGGLVKSWLGKFEVSIEYLMHAIRLNPLDPYIHRVYTGLALSNFCLARYEEAVVWSEKARLAQPNFTIALVAAAVCLVGVGRMQEAQGVVAQLRAIMPDGPNFKFGCLQSDEPVQGSRNDCERTAQGLDCQNDRGLGLKMALFS